MSASPSTGNCIDKPAGKTAAPLVCTVGDRRTLEFMAGSVQSEMRLSDPTALVLAYCRAMMCFALFVPHPRHIVMVGLGGGSLAKFCHRYFPATRITVLELRADVIALRAQFGVPPDDERLRVVHADATVWLASAHQCADVLIVDGFDEAGLPAALGSARFYGHCRRALTDGGVLVANVFSYDPLYAAIRERLRLMFDDRLCSLDKAAGNNRILFAIKAQARLPAPGSTTAVPATVMHALRMQRRIARLSAWCGGWTSRVLVRLLITWLKRRTIG